MKLLWITHRRRDDLSAKSRSGISKALKSRGWEIQFMSPDGDFRVERSAMIGRGHRGFTRSVSSIFQAWHLIYSVWPLLNGLL